MSHSTRKLDLTGQEFGDLTVLAPAENVGGRTAWHCRCACGKEMVAKTYHLRSGHTASCGCMSRAAAGNTAQAGMLLTKTVRKNNTSGVPGVDWRASKGVWRASICFQGRRYYLGGYKKFDDAVKARRCAEEMLREQFLKESPTKDTAPQEISNTLYT